MARWRGRALVRGLDQAVVETIATAREQMDPDREMELLHAAGIGILTVHDTGHPLVLREIDDLPPALYVKGHLR